MKKYVISGLLLVSISSVSWANDSGLLNSQGYSCAIKTSWRLADDGNLALPSTFGGKFVVDRDTGRTLGAIKNYNKTAYGDFQPKVIDRGNHEQYFKALTIYGSHNPSIDVLVVQEFADSKLKPFLFTHNGEVTTGVCENI